jgi:hypothetical protein
MTLTTINVKGIEQWRKYEFNGTTLRIENPVTVQFRQGGETHRVTAPDGTVYCVPAPGYHGCILSWKGEVVA